MRGSRRRSPTRECALVVEEDEGALDGCALGGVAGEGVAVLEVLGRIASVERAERACVRLQRERLVAVEVDDGCARAVADAAACVVAAAEDAVADAELAPAELRALRARAGRPGSSSVRAASLRSRTSSRRWASITVPARSRLGGLPPVLEQPLLGDVRVVLEVQASAAGGVGEVGLGVAVAQLRERFALGRVVLAAVL